MNRKDQILIAEAYQLIQESDTVGRAYRLTKGYGNKFNIKGERWKDYYNTIKQSQREADAIERRKNNKVRVEHAIWTNRWYEMNDTLSAEERESYIYADERGRQMIVTNSFHNRIINRLDFLLSKQDKEISVTVQKQIASKGGEVVLTGVADNLLEYYHGDAGTRYPFRDGKEDGVNKFATFPGGANFGYDEAVVNLQDVKWDGYYNGLAEPDNTHGESGTQTYTRYGYFHQNDPEQKIIGYLFQKDNPITDETRQKLATGELKQKKVKVTEGIPLSKKVDDFLSKKGLKKYDKQEDLYELRYI